MQNRETAQKEPCQHCGRTDYRWTHEFRVSLSFSPEDKLEIRCDYCRPLRMDAYYFEFAETGVEAIDRILSAVAQAGKGYHHTESWGDEGLADMGEFHGGSYVAWIQNAANDAAKVLAAKDKQLEQERLVNNRLRLSWREDVDEERAKLNHTRARLAAVEAERDKAIDEQKCADPSEWPEDLRVREFPR